MILYGMRPYVIVVGCVRVPGHGPKYGPKHVGASFLMCFKCFKY